jgi:uncharacterized protein YdaT
MYEFAWRSPQFGGRLGAAHEATASTRAREGNRDRNALLDEGMKEGKAIRIAIAKAKEWAKQREDS